MIAEYKINVGDGKQITAGGDMDKLDEMCLKLQEHQILCGLLLEIRDTARANLPALGMTQAQWNQHRLNKIASIAKRDLEAQQS